MSCFAQSQVEDVRRRAERREQEIRAEAEQRLTTYVKIQTQALSVEVSKQQTLLRQLEAKLKSEKDKKKLCVQKLQKEQEQHRQEMDVAEQR
jgi:hypothetical protein